MAWLWNSWEEFVKVCNPVGIRRGTFQRSQSNTGLESAQHLLDCFSKLSDASDGLKKLGFKGQDFTSPKYDPALVNDLHHHVMVAVYAGEEMLIYHKRLAQSDAAYGFLHSNALLDHWESYVGGNRLVYEIQQFMDDIDKLVAGYRHMERDDERLLLGDLTLPIALEKDFRLSRNLFSVGFDEVGLFIAARGLENVLRRIAADRHIQISIGPKTEPASEATLHDIIEAMARVKWKVKGTALISRETGTLLQYVRTVRNGGAHSGTQDMETEQLRQTASIIANSANRLWMSVATNRAKLDPTTIVKRW